MDYGWIKASKLEVDDTLVIPSWQVILGVIDSIEPQTDWDGSKHIMVEYVSPSGGTSYVRFATNEKTAIALWRTV